MEVVDEESPAWTGPAPAVEEVGVPVVAEVAAAVAGVTPVE